MVAAGGDVVFCTDINQGGTCVTKDYNDNECGNFGSTLVNQISSVNPTGSGHRCTLYINLDCTDGITYTFTGHHDSIPSPLNDAASSFMCSS